MPEFAILRTSAPYHIISYGTLLGVEFFQSFVGGIVAYKALPRPQFATLQQKLFPIYFSIQTGLPIVLALTYPGVKTSLGAASGLSGVFALANRWSVLIPLGTIFLTSLINLVAVGPATTKIMKDRKHQETRDGKKSYDPAPHSKEMEALNSSFATMHGISSLLNMAGWLATMWYGVSIAERLN